MKIKKYIDGISFLNDSEQEVAFYSKFTDRIRYVQNNVNCIGCIEIPYEINLLIMTEVTKYKKGEEN